MFLKRKRKRAKTTKKEEGKNKTADEEVELKSASALELARLGRFDSSSCSLLRASNHKQLARFHRPNDARAGLKTQRVDSAKELRVERAQRVDARRGFFSAMSRERSPWRKKKKKKALEHQALCSAFASASSLSCEALTR